MKTKRFILSFVLIAALLHVNNTSAQTNKKDFFNKIKSERITSDSSVEWKNFGPGMSGYCEEYWCHPTDTNVMFMGPDMHVSYGTWDNGKSWQTIKDYDGDGKDLERVLDIDFSLTNPDFGVAIERYGQVFTTNDRGHTWQLIKNLEGNNKGTYHCHTQVAIDPKNENIWYIGAGDFWNVKFNHRSKKQPHGIKHNIASYGYILKTTDKGKTFKKIATGISEDLDVGRIVIHPENPKQIIIATNFGVFLSNDAGETWVSGSKGLPNNLPRDLSSYYNAKTKEFILYLVEQTVYEPSGKTVQSKGGVYKSMDGGKSWVNITGNLGVNLNKISYFFEKENYYKTVAAWLNIDKKDFKENYPDFPENALSVYNRLVVNPINKDEIYLVHNKKHDIAFGPGDLFKTEDGGKTWFACARNGQYWIGGKDNDYWNSINQPTGANIDFAHLQVNMDNNNESSGNRMIAINKNGQVFIGIDQQTLRSDNGGKSWYQVDDFETAPGSNKWVGRGDSDLPGRFMLLETGKKGRYLLCSGEHGLWQTTDLGDYPDKDAVAVEQIEGQVHDHSGNHGAHSISTVAVHPKNPDIIYFIGWRQEHRGKIRRSMDGGKTWENISTIFEGKNSEWRGLGTQSSLMIDPVNPDNMYFCAIRKTIQEVGSAEPESNFKKGKYGIYYSSDGGYNWSLQTSGLPEGCSVRRLVMDPKNPETIYACLNKFGAKDNFGLYVSKDKSKTWEKVTIPANTEGVNNLFIDRNTNYMYLSCGNRSGASNTGGVWLSKNNGKSWEKFFDVPYVWQTEVSPVNSNIIVVNVPAHNDVKNPGIYLTKDGGKNWMKINKGIGQPDKMTDVKPDPYNEKILWSAAWGSGWFKAIIK